MLFPRPSPLSQTPAGNCRRSLCCTTVPWGVPWFHCGRAVLRIPRHFFWLRGHSAPLPMTAMPRLGLLMFSCMFSVTYPSMTPSCFVQVNEKPEPGPSPCTSLKAVRKLLPGHTDTVNCLSMAEASVYYTHHILVSEACLLKQSDIAFCVVFSSMQIFFSLDQMMGLLERG